MILFLDTVSSLPEFSIIEDNKIIYVQKIIKNDKNKMSECIFPAYIELTHKYSLENKLEYLIVNTGPGSYTALRIGIAFLSGLSIAKNIDLFGLPCLDLFLYKINKEQFDSTAIFIESSNNQKFLCVYNCSKLKYEIHKYDSNFHFNNFEKNSIKKIITNSNSSLKSLSFVNTIELEKISFRELVINNVHKIIKKPKQNIIEPIYISNNQLLN